MWLQYSCNYGYKYNYNYWYRCSYSDSYKYIYITNIIMNIMQHNVFINKIYMLVLFTSYNYKIYIWERYEWTYKTLLLFLQHVRIQWVPAIVATTNQCWRSKPILRRHFLYIITNEWDINMYNMKGNKQEKGRKTWWNRWKMKFTGNFIRII